MSIAPRLRKLKFLPGSLHRIRDGEEVVCVPKNISEKGLCVETNVNFLPDMQVVFKVDEEEIVLNMVWCKPADFTATNFQYGFRVNDPGINLIERVKDKKCFDYNILLVEDDEDIADIYGAALIRNGYQVKTATDVLFALRLLKQIDVDFIISDWVMPNGGGQKIIEEALKLQIPAAIVSGFVEQIQSVGPVQVYDKIDLHPDDLSALVVDTLANSNYEFEMKLKKIKDSI